MSEEIIGYTCPDCHHELKFDEKKYECTSCNAIWPIEYGIPRFGKRELFWSVFDKDVAEEVAEYAEQNTWEDAVQKYGEILGDYTLGYIRNTSRSDWHVLLPIDPDSVVVDIGSGWGNIGLNIAKRCKQLYCGDANMQNLRLLKTRVRDEKADNVKTFLYDANEFLRLPFADNSVDVAYLNGVLEWIGNVEHKASPDKLQLEALKEIRRILKPGGSLYIGIENRYSVSTIRGRSLHFEIPFVGLFPRWFSNAVTKMVRKMPHRTYVYSLFGYRRILNQSGFNDMDFYWPYPSYHDANYLIPLEPAWVKRYWFSKMMVSRSRKFRIACKMGLTYLPFHWLAYSYSIRARK
ncbi:MAG: methyltransferase domain-containing protein [Pseudomonadota bacterium]